jgi:putative transposase
MYKCRCPQGGREAVRTRYATTKQMRALSYQEPPHTLSQEGRARLHWITWHYAHGKNKSLTARHFGISRPTLSKWLSRYDNRHLKSLESHPKRPYRVRRPELSTDAVLAVLELRKRFPRWGKKKLVVLLRRAGWTLSQSTVGRILAHLRRSGQLHYYCRQVQMRWRRSQRPWATRKPKDYGAVVPGDIVQIDTVDLRPLPDKVFKQLSLTDVVSRWSALEVKSRATARVTRDSLKAMLGRLPFPVKAVQIDGGSEFMAETEAYCQQLGLRLFVLPPHSPKLNGRVEHFNRTSREEFHECSTADATVAALQAAALEWEQVYNTVRPHEALGQKTPLEYLDQYPTLYPEVAAWQL